MVLTIKEVMDTRFVTVDAATTVREATRAMVASRHGFALLLSGGRPEGIVTEWDLLEKVVAPGLDPAATPIGAIASRPVVACDQETPTAEVIDRMVRNGIRRMVITRDGAVVGVVGAKDVLASFRSYVDRISADIARLQSSFP